MLSVLVTLGTNLTISIGNVNKIDTYDFLRGIFGVNCDTFDEVKVMARRLNAGLRNPHEHHELS